MSRNFFVFDTNTLLSGLLIENSTPSKALKLARTKGELLISNEVAAEYIEVFSREKFEKYAPLLNRLIFIENIVTNAVRVTIKAPIIACRDSRDDKFLSLAVAAKAS